MISPFPELNPIASQGQPASDIVSITSALLPSLIDQARFKPSEIILAADPKHGSRYLIGPSRVTSDGKEQRYGIASGLLGGFGGFVARAFRDHDYQLGRRNCQRFLQTAFALPADNGLIKSWHTNVDKTQFKAIRTEDEKKRNDPETYCIIPLCRYRRSGSRPASMAANFTGPFRRIANAHCRAVRRRGAKIAGAKRERAFYIFCFRSPCGQFPGGIGLIRDKVLNYVQAFIKRISSGAT